jgi:trk system potassium uptake protein TrkH
MAGFMLVPAAFAWFTQDEEYSTFLISAGLSSIAGLFLMLPGIGSRFTLNSRQLYMLTSFSWLSLSFFSALPLALSHHPLSLIDAVFEAVSGITTTGSTVMSNLSALPHSILLWRSMLQWIGGLGVIGMAVSILPFLQVGGMRLFQTESSDWSDKSLPRFHDLARGLLLVYLGITLVCALSYLAAGMTLFDAINHAMTTISTGGYATHDRSMGRFNSTILWIAVVFMLIGGMPFMLYIRFLSQRKLYVLKDQQAAGFLAIVVGLIGILSLQQMVTTEREPFEVLTHAAFNTVSVITTTGYASTDYTLWGYFSIGFFFIVTFIGGCSGSTSGGMKIFRFQLSWLFLKNQMNKLVHPHGIFSIRYNGKSVSDDIMASAVAFSFLFFLLLAATTLALTTTGLDVVTSLTGAATALTNVGPGLGDMIGPAGNFAAVPGSGKLILGFAMILGRLEMLTVMVLLTPVFWKG